MHAAMRDVSSQAVTTPSSPRNAALTEFGSTVATLPYNKGAVQASLVRVQEEGGEELKVEVCCTVAAFETVTRVVDATLRKDPPGAMVSVVKGINTAMHHSRELILAGSAFVAVGIAAAIVARKS